MHNFILALVAATLLNLVSLSPTVAQVGDKAWCFTHQRWCPKQHKIKKDTIMASVVGRHVFYPGSYYGDEIDSSKTALLPGGTGAFVNYISRTVGGVPWSPVFRGIYVDIADLASPGSITAADFTFKYGNDDDPSGWLTAEVPDAVAVTEGGGVDGSDRIKITWVDSAMPNSRWLQVTVLANANTGLSRDDVHYWGLAGGETGNSATDAEVTYADMIAVFNNIDPVNPVPITSPYDISRDGWVLSGDISTVSQNLTSEAEGTALLLISPPVPPVVASYVELVGTEQGYSKLIGSSIEYTILEGTEQSYVKLIGLRLDYPSLQGAEQNYPKLVGY